MSYILDALKKADAERSRGQVPHLMDQPPTGVEAAHTPPGRRFGLLAAGCTGLIVLTVAAGWLLRGNTPAQPPSPAPAVASSIPTPVTVAPMPATPTPAPSVPAAQTPSPPEAGTAPQPVPDAEARPSARPRTPEAEPARLPQGAEVGAPPVQVGFSRYDPDPARRKLMLDGNVLREGDLLAPGHRLVRIDVRSAVLEWQGSRYRIQY